MMTAAKATAQTPPLHFCCLVKGILDAILNLLFLLSPVASPDLVGLALALSRGHSLAQGIGRRCCRAR